MSYVSFLRQGPQATQFETYRRDHYDPDVVQNIGTSNDFSGTAKKRKTDDNKQEILIDGAVKITTVADAVRKKAQSVWSRLSKASMINFSVTLIGGIAGITSAVALGILVPPLFPIALAVGAASLGTFGFSVFTLCRAKEAKRQLHLWEDPAVRVQNQRQKVGREGFYYAYKSKLKDSVVSQEELQSLWFRDMDKYVEKYNGAVVEMPSLIREFMEKTPIEKSPFTYTFGQVTPESKATSEVQFLKGLSDKFANLKRQYDDIRQQTESSKDTIQREKQRALNQNDAQKDLMLEPYRLLIQPKREALCCQRQRLEMTICEQRAILRQIGGTVSRGRAIASTCVDRTGRVVVGGHAASSEWEISRIESTICCHEQTLREIDAELTYINLTYSAMTAPVRAMHQRNAAAIKRWASGELKDIQQNEEKILVKFFEPIKVLLNEYANRSVGKEEAKVETCSEVKVDATPSAPPLEEECDPPEFDPGWERVFGRVDWEKRVLKTFRTASGEEATTTKHYS